MQYTVNIQVTVMAESPNLTEVWEKAADRIWHCSPDPLGGIIDRDDNRLGTIAYEPGEGDLVFVQSPFVSQGDQPLTYVRDIVEDYDRQGVKYGAYYTVDYDDNQEPGDFYVTERGAWPSIRLCRVGRTYDSVVVRTRDVRGLYSSNV